MKIHSNPDAGANKSKTLVVFAGPCLTGKTILAKNVCNTLGIAVIDIDDIRAEICPREEVGVILPNEREREVMLKCYKEMYRRAEIELNKQSAVAVVATHSKEEYHDMASTAAENASAKLMAVVPNLNLIDDPASFLSDRLRLRNERRDSSSNVRGDDALSYALEVYGRYKEIDSKHASVIIKINPNYSISELEKRIVNELSSQLALSLRR